MSLAVSTLPRQQLERGDAKNAEKRRGHVIPNNGAALPCFISQSSACLRGLGVFAFGFVPVVANHTANNLYFRGLRRQPFCSHKRQTMKNASLTMLPDIFEWPCARSVKMIGTSTIFFPRRQSLLVSSI